MTEVVSFYDFIRLVRRYKTGSASRKATLITLAEHAGLIGEDWSCYPGQDLLAEETEQSVGTVRRHLRQLEEAGVLLRQVRNTRNGRTANLYVFDLAVLSESPARNLTGGEMEPSAQSEPSPARTSGVEPSAHLARAEVPRKYQKTELPVARARDSQLPLDLEEARQQFQEHFWPTYPARDGKKIGKAACLLFWERMPLEDRRAARRGAANLRDAVAAGGIFGVPDPERFLRRRLFDDWQEPAQIRAGPHRSQTNVERSHESIARVTNHFKEQANGSGTGRTSARGTVIELPSTEL